MRYLSICLLLAFGLTGCLGPVALHQAVLGYDETVSRLDRQMLLLNVARTHRNLPGHFTVTSSIAATFDYRTSVGLSGAFFGAPMPNAYGVTLGASTAENPTLSIVPIQGEDFTARILTPMDESKFEFLVFQGAPIDMVMRLMADGIEVQNPDGSFQRFVLNRASRPAEYEEFRRRVAHLAWLNASRHLFVSTLTFEEALPAPAGALPLGDLIGALQKGYRWRPGPGGGDRLSRLVSGRVAVTNYDPRSLSDAELRALDLRAGDNPRNFVLVDIRPGHPGGDYPLFGAFKLRSLNAILAFIAEAIDRHPEFDVQQDPRTGAGGPNPRHALHIEVRGDAPRAGIPAVSTDGGYYAVADTPWDLEAFTLLYYLFQMTVTDVSRVAVPSITIGK